MDEDASLRRYGLNPVGASLDEVRDLLLLTVQVRVEQEAQGHGDTELMKLCCVQLFNAGSLDDVLLIRQAKSASMDGIPAKAVQVWIQETPADSWAVGGFLTADK
ncbi:4-oxalocrotonate tautomerase family protein [Streptomyces sp. NPDC060053]|uniref:tautomerase family protein n=1 Tax=Streptomyces sp. NPDC060053 TaxID=3347047 RepID=UPI00368040D8